MSITVVTVHYNSFQFVRLMYESLSMLAQGQFEMLICDNGSRMADKNRLNRYFADKNNVEVIFRDQGNEQASCAHARGLDLLLSRVDTEYALIMDSDCVLLRYGWDQILIDAMKSSEIIGTAAQKEHTGSRMGGTTFPLPFAMFLRVSTFRSLGVSFMPRDITQGEDTAWELKVAYENKKLPYQIFDSYNTRTFQSGPFACLEGAGEYYYQDKLISSHFGRGSTGGLAKYFREAPHHPVFSFFRWLKGMREMQLWIKICRTLVAEQCRISD